MNLSEKLRISRNRLGLTLEVVAERTGIAASALSDFENSHREPKLAQLQQLAQTYHQSISFLLDEHDFSLQSVLWRQRPDNPPAEQLEAQLFEWAKNFHRLELLCESHIAHELPTETGPADRYSDDKAAELAYRVRTTLGLGDRPGLTLLRVLEDVCNIKVFCLAFEPAAISACAVSEEFGAAILLNSGNARWQRNLDLADQLFHLLTWKIFRQNSEPSAVVTESEKKWATWFARHLLMPTEAFRKAVNAQKDEQGKLGIDGLYEVAREFDVPCEAVLWHMNFVFHLDPEKVADIVSRLATSRDTRESDQPPRYPHRYVALCHQAFRKGLLSTGRYAEYLGISRQQAMKHFEQNAVEDVEVEFSHT